MIMIISYLPKRKHDTLRQIIAGLVSLLMLLGFLFLGILLAVADVSG